ncbi:hypothetical protein PAPYR_8052 [Paratrimastix pyriformis]|uniref:Uncharacterized protein n=1 Tax=Paratrimastix pyriformis TaxID=342808 RepID=A0ABQ8UBJ1_9EUKA|nr:hypothetical protein PAPYR_8052 [Paratrimastix pyriformis]
MAAAQQPTPAEFRRLECLVAKQKEDLAAAKAEHLKQNSEIVQKYVALQRIATELGAQLRQAQRQTQDLQEALRKTKIENTALTHENILLKTIYERYKQILPPASGSPLLGKNSPKPGDPEIPVSHGLRLNPSPKSSSPPLGDSKKVGALLAPVILTLEQNKTLVDDVLKKLSAPTTSGAVLKENHIPAHDVIPTIKATPAPRRTPLAAAPITPIPVAALPLVAPATPLKTTVLVPGTPVPPHKPAAPPAPEISQPAPDPAAPAPGKGERPQPIPSSVAISGVVVDAIPACPPLISPLPAGFQVLDDDNDDSAPARNPITAIATPVGEPAPPTGGPAAMMVEEPAWSLAGAGPPPTVAPARALPQKRLPLPSPPRQPISYATPPLNRKLRKGDPHTFGINEDFTIPEHRRKRTRGPAAVRPQAAAAHRTTQDVDEGAERGGEASTVPPEVNPADPGKADE